MAGFSTPHIPADPGDHATAPLDMAEFSEILNGSQAMIRELQSDPRAQESQAVRQTSEALGYIGGVMNNGAVTPEDVLRQVSDDVITQAAGTLATLAQEGKEPTTVDLAQAGRLSSLYGLGVGLKALAFTEQLHANPAQARTLDSWNKQGRHDFIAGIAFGENRIPDPAKLQDLQRRLQ